MPNPQGEGGKTKAKCEDFASALGPVQVVYTGKNAGEYDVDPETMTINVDDEVAISRGGKKFDADTKLEISDEFGLVQKLTIHTSCSKDLAEGDEFGSLFVEELGLIPK